MDIIYLVYGLSFLAMGLAVVLHADQDSPAPVARSLWLLAGFGFVHGLREWGNLWQLMHGNSQELTIFLSLSLLVSFLFLFEFGLRLLVHLHPRSGLGAIPGFALYLVPLTALAAGVALSPQPWVAIEVWSRYLLGLPGALMAGAALVRMGRNPDQFQLSSHDELQTRRAFVTAGYALMGYGVFAGGIVPQMPWFPASAFSQESFLDLFGVPVQLVRASMAVLAAYGVGLVMRLFHLESVTCLRDSRFRLLTIIDNVQDAIIEVNAQGRIQFWNRSAAQMFGYGREEVLGKRLTDMLVPERFWRDFGSAFQELARTGQGTIPGQRIQAMARRSDGSEVPVEVAVTAVPDHQGFHAVGLVNDITERLEIEAVRRRQDQENHALMQRLDLLLNNTPEGIVGLDLQGRITFATPAAAQLMGWAEVDAMHGIPCHLALGHAGPDRSPCTRHNSRILAAIADGTSVRVTDEFFTRLGGGAFAVEYVVSPQIENSSDVGAVVAFHDISARKELEGDIRRSNAELEQFAYVVSHDLRQPLRMVASYLALLERRLRDNLDGDSVKYMAFAMAGAKRMENLIQGLLDYSRVGRQGQAEDVPLSRIMDEVLANLAGAIVDSQARIHLAPDLPVVMGNPLDMMRLFQNLIANALKFQERGQPPQIRITHRDGGAFWIIQVADNGIGIAPQDVGRLFQVFQRLVTVDQYEGTGIGLAICKKIAEQSGGTIAVQSEPGQGSTFLVSLPKVL